MLIIWLHTHLNLYAYLLEEYIYYILLKIYVKKISDKFDKSRIEIRENDYIYVNLDNSEIRNEKLPKSDNGISSVS